MRAREPLMCVFVCVCVRNLKPTLEGVVLCGRGQVRGDQLHSDSFSEPFSSLNKERLEEEEIRRSRETTSKLKPKGSESLNV